MTKNLADYVDSELKKMLPNFKWKIVQNSKKKLIEIYVTFHVETDESAQVQDIIGNNNEPGLVQFEDVICFYDPAYAHVKPQNYLASFSMDSHAGIEKGYVDAVIRHLNYVTKKGKVELTEFLNDDYAESFRLSWNEGNLNRMIDTSKETGRYNGEKVSLSFNDDKSFFEKLKEDDADDGVERV